MNESVTSDLVEFLRAQYDRIEVRERDNTTIRMPLDAKCPTCGKHVDEFSTSTASGRVVEFPCGHEMPTNDFIRKYGESNPDPFVLADLESKRRAIDELLVLPHHAWEGRSEYGCPKFLDAETWAAVMGDAEQRCTCGRDDHVERMLRIFARPFSGQPDYNEDRSA